MAVKQRESRWYDVFFDSVDVKPTIKFCQTCKNRAIRYKKDYFDNEKPMYPVEDKARNEFCSVYPPVYGVDEDGEEIMEGGKPDDVHWEGAPCQYYEKADDKPLSLMVGLAVGDALGVPVEFEPRGSFHVEDMQGYGTHNQPPGTWSDDTSLALATADGMHLLDEISLSWIGHNFLAWYMHGKYTPYGEVFDIGGTTARAIERLRKPSICRDHPTFAGGTGERENGNGSLMRIAPITFYLYRVHDVAERYRIVKGVSSLTHAHEISVTACFLYMEMLNHVRDGIPVQQAYERLRKSAVQDFPFIREETKRKFWRILEEDIRTLPEAKIRSGGYVIDTLEASLWCVLTTENYRDAVLKAVNLGDDTDTTGAVAGAMAGLAYGLESIPQEWKKQLAAYEMIESYAVNMPRWDYIERLSRGLRP